MDRIDIPQDLSGLAEDDLHALSTQIEEAAAELGTDASRSDENLVEIERLATEYERLSDELALREEAASERAARAEAALGRIGGPVVPDESVETMDETEVEPIAASADSTTITLSAEGTPTFSEGEDEGDSADDSADETETEEVDEADAESETSDADADEAEAPDPENTEELAVADETSPIVPKVSAKVLSGLTQHRPAAAAPVDASLSERRNVALVATGVSQGTGIKDGDVLDQRSLANAIVAKHHQLSKMGQGSIMEPIVVATARTDFPREQMLTSGAEENYSIFDSITRQATALVAAGGNCAPLSPSYEFFRMASPMSPVEDCLPVVGAPRGGIRYIVPPDFRDASGGVRVTTEAEDAAGYPPTLPKPCVRVECPDIVECQVDAVSQCVTFGNLNYRVFPEQVEDFLKDLAVIFAETKEVFYLDAINAGSTQVNITPPYGATRGIVFSLLLAAHGYRKRNHMAVNAPLDIMIPDTLVPFIKADMVNDHALGLNFLYAEWADVAKVFQTWGLNPCFYYDSTTLQGAASNLEQAQAIGGLNGWPTTYRAYLFGPGTWVRLDGGTLDVGLVRDSTLNSTNDLQLFSEQWVQACKLGIESIALNITLCPDGGGPEPHPLLVCAS